MESLIKQLEQEELELQFESFSNKDAWELGSILKKKGESTPGITINITRNRQQLFHYSFEGTTQDNDHWVKRKTNLVYRFFHSSYLIGQRLKLINSTIEDKYLLSESEFAPHGGCFPIIIKNTGVVGTITVSGLSQELDHKMVVDTIREYLSKGKKN